MEKFNCFETSLVDIWNSEERSRFLKKMLRETYKAFDVCATCAMRYDSTFSEHDNLDPYAGDV
jgi:MoaA/NifB/PqqE/SkfB family radical SAM enzyme